MANKEIIKSDIMNLIGYGLAKFDTDFVKEFDMSSKAAFARHIVQLGLATTEKAVSNRMDSFDPYFDNGRKGWFQRNQREHIKLYIDIENVMSKAEAKQKALLLPNTTRWAMDLTPRPDLRTLSST